MTPTLLALTRQVLAEDWSTVWVGMALTTELTEEVFKFKTKIDSFWNKN